MTRAESNRRLLKLAAFLVKVPRERFDFSLWISADWEGAVAIDQSCGAVACAAGWATAIPEFKELGLELKRQAHIPYFVPTYLEAVADMALSQFFGVSDQSIHHLFYPGALAAGATPEQAAKHIRAFVKERR